MLFVQIPYAIGWIMLYKASEFWHIIVGLSFLGMARGLSEAVIITFVGECRYLDAQKGFFFSFQIYFFFQFSLIWSKWAKNSECSSVFLFCGYGNWRFYHTIFEYVDSMANHSSSMFRNAFDCCGCIVICGYFFLFLPKNRLLNPKTKKLIQNCRSQTPRNGFYPKIERSKQKNRFVGFGVGFQAKQWKKNLQNSNDIANGWNFVNLVSNRIYNAHIRSQRSEKNCTNWRKDEVLNLSLSWLYYISQSSSPVWLLCNRLWCKFWKLMRAQSPGIRWWLS